MDKGSVERFSDRADDYVKYRPTYPTEAIDAVLDGLGRAHGIVAADIGAGTGISARLLADRGVRVVAVEPGEAMRRSAEAHPNVVWVSGRAEATGLRAQAADLVVCAQSFHWFRPAEALSEFARILKPRGRLAVIFNRRSETDPFTLGYREAILAVCGDTTAEAMPFDPGLIARSGLFSPPERTSCPNAQQLDLGGLIGRARSASYVPKSGAAGQQITDSLRSLHARYADAEGFVTLAYETEVFFSTPR